MSARRARALRRAALLVTAPEGDAQRTYRAAKRAWGALSHPERRRLLRRRGAGGRGR